VLLGIGDVQLCRPAAGAGARSTAVNLLAGDRRALSGMMLPARDRRRSARAQDGQRSGVVNWLVADLSAPPRRGSAPFYRQRQGELVSSAASSPLVSERSVRGSSTARLAKFKIRIRSYPRTAGSRRQCVEKFPEAGPAGPSPFSFANTCSVLDFIQTPLASS
jgi:hypothetical protein